MIYVLLKLLKFFDRIFEIFSPTFNKIPQSKLVGFIVQINGMLEWKYHDHNDYPLLYTVNRQSSQQQIWEDFRVLEV